MSNWNRNGEVGKISEEITDKKFPDFIKNYKHTHERLKKHKGNDAKSQH